MFVTKVLFMRSVLAIVALIAWHLGVHAQDSVRYIYENLGSEVNSEFNESGPRISPDGKSLYFFRNNHPDNMGGNDIWVAHLNEDSSWTKAELVSDLNNYFDNSVHTVFDDGKKLLLHDIYLPNKTSKAGISISEKTENGWSFPKPLKFKKYVNDTNICSFHISNDGSTLVLAIKGKDTKGKQDLYVSFYDSDKKKWSEPKDLGATINSASAEATAFLDDDLKTLYYSSDGLGGEGGFDIFRTVRQDDSWTNWSSPENIGKPYNTADDEFYYSQPHHTQYVYLAHSHEHGHSDIVRIKKEIVIIPDPEATITCRVFDKKTGKRINANIKIEDLATNEEVMSDEADTLKGFEIKTKEVGEYEIYAQVAGYLGNHEHLSIQLDKDDVTITKDIYLEPIEVGVVVKLDNIFFETNKAVLKEESFPALKKVLKVMADAPNIKVEIAGHTDNVGSDSYNLKLSDDRAASVVTYLVDNGVDKKQLVSKGYGETTPVETNDTEEGRQNNRRVEFKILEVNK